MKRFLFSAGSILFLAVPAFAQLYERTNDAQLWENIYLEKNITKKLVAHLNHEGRITDNISSFNYGYADIGLTYKLKKWVRVSLDYVYVRKKNYDDYIANRHQVYGALTFRKKFGNLHINNRNMIQWEWQNPYTSRFGHPSGAAGGGLAQLYYRNKVTARCTFGSIWPYVATEFYYSLIDFDKYGRQFDRIRYYIGSFYSLNAVSAFEAYYMVENNMNINQPQTNWVIGIGFEYSFYAGGLMGKW